MKTISELRGMRPVYIAGVGLTPFRRYKDEEWYDFGSRAILEALKNAEMVWGDIQAAFLGSVYQGTGSGHQAISEVGLTGIPIINVENACSSSTVALRLAYQSVATELYDVCLAGGFEKMPRKGTFLSTAWREWERYMGFNVQLANYALGAQRYMEEYGATEEDFARVTVKNRKNGALNPRAIFQKEVTIEEVLNSRMIAKPMHLLNCCPLADGGVAYIVCSGDKLKSKNKKVAIATSVLTSGTYGLSGTGAGNEAYGGGSVKIHNIDVAELAAKQAWEVSGYGPEDIDIFEAYDTMSPSELWSIEDMGFCKKGEAPHLLREGMFDIDGKLPVNTDGGLMSCGHPLGATGGRQVCEIYWQLREEAGPRQVAGAKIGMCHTKGAGPNSCVTILKR